MLRKLLKVAAFVKFPTSIMVLFEIHQRFKDHFLNELRVYFKNRFLTKLNSISCDEEICAKYCSTDN